MELTTVKSRKGKDIYILDLEELVRDNYTNSDINKVIASKSEFTCVCPLCLDRKGKNYTKRKLYITSDFSVGHCFVCDSAFMNIASDEPSDIETENDIEITFESNKLMLPKMDLSLLDKIPLASANKESIKYLNNRNPYLNIDKYNLKYIKNKLVIPFKFIDKDIFYQIRFLQPTNPDMKYYTPGRSHGVYAKPFYIASDHWDQFRPTILTEGVFSAIATDCTGVNANVIALIGNCITPYQMELLKYLGFNDIYAYLDKIELSKKLAENIRLTYGYKSRIIPPVTNGSELDQEEEIRRIGPTKLLEHINNALNYRTTRLPYSNQKSFELDFNFSL